MCAPQADVCSLLEGCGQAWCACTCSCAPQADACRSLEGYGEGWCACACGCSLTQCCARAMLALLSLCTGTSACCMQTSRSIVPCTLLDALGQHSKHAEWRGVHHQLTQNNTGVQVQPADTALLGAPRRDHKCCVPSLGQFSPLLFPRRRPQNMGPARGAAVLYAPRPRGRHHVILLLARWRLFRFGWI